MVALFAVAGAVAGAAACEPESERCDRDQRYFYGLCYEIDAPPGDGGSDASFAHFGESCTASTVCAAPTDYCAKQPADATGYCTRTGCLADASICPAGWTCVDQSTLQPGLPAICVQP